MGAPNLSVAVPSAFASNYHPGDAGKNVGSLLDGTQASNTEQLTGLASCYDPVGGLRADQKPFDPNDRSAAMYGKGTFGKTVNVFRLDSGGEVISQALNVKVNDTGPFASDKRGRVIRPFQAHPTRIIDLTPKVYKELTAFPDCEEGPGVIHVRVE
ncbi:MAG: septal ring lytic transglycosylase RlpA family protein [Syntrophobacteraceae bacterium]